MFHEARRSRDRSSATTNWHDGATSLISRKSTKYQWLPIFNRYALPCWQYKLEVEKQKFQNTVPSGSVKHSNSPWASQSHVMAWKNSDWRPFEYRFKEKICPRGPGWCSQLQVATGYISVNRVRWTHWSITKIFNVFFEAKLCPAAIGPLDCYFSR